jgi:hypothetical protein
MINWEDNSTCKSLTRHMFNEWADSIFRDFGMHNGKIRRHSKKCVYLEDNKGITRWCCSDDCEMK